MDTEVDKSFRKSERLSSKKLIDVLFTGGQVKSMSAWPVRLVYTLVPASECQEKVNVLMSVSKRHFKHAVDRNRVKRQLREAYRLNNSMLKKTVAERQKESLLMAFIWTADEKKCSEEVSNKVRQLMLRLSEKLSQ